MKNIRTLLAVALLTVASLAHAATFNLFQPASGILVGNPSTYVTTAATSSNVIALWSGTCNASSFLRGDGACAAVSVSPGGSTTQVQYNNAGAFAGDAGLTYDAGSDALRVPNINGASAGALSLSADTNLLASGGDQVELQAGGGASSIFMTDTAINIGTVGAGTDVTVNAVDVVTLIGNTVSASATNAINLLTNGSTRLSLQDDGAWSVDTDGTGSSGQVLTSNGASAPPTWENTVNPSNVALLDQQNGFFFDLDQNAGQSFVNGSTGTLARNYLAVANLSRDIRVGVTGTNFSGSAFTDAPAGEIGFLRTEAMPLVLGTNNTQRLAIDTSGAWTLGTDGVGSSGQVLTSNGASTPPTWETPSAGGSVANPTATIGLTAVNGVATSAIRSDGAPALSQAIAPTWTGVHTFGNTTTGASIASTSPRLLFNDTNGGTDRKIWACGANDFSFACSTRTDADGAGATWLDVVRSPGTAVTQVAIGVATGQLVTLGGAGTQVNNGFGFANGSFSNSSLASSQNDFNPWSGLVGNVLKLASIAGAINITGIVRSTANLGYQMMTVCNDDNADTITLTANDAASAAQNRFMMNANKPLAPNQCAFFMYDEGNVRWRLLN